MNFVTWIQPTDTQHAFPPRFGAPSSTAEIGKLLKQTTFLHFLTGTVLGVPSVLPVRCIDNLQVGMWLRHLPVALGTVSDSVMECSVFHLLEVAQGPISRLWMARAPVISGYQVLGPGSYLHWHFLRLSNCSGSLLIFQTSWSAEMWKLPWWPVLQDSRHCCWRSSLWPSPPFLPPIS